MKLHKHTIFLTFLLLIVLSIPAISIASNAGTAKMVLGKVMLITFVVHDPVLREDWSGLQFRSNTPKRQVPVILE